VKSRVQDRDKYDPNYVTGLIAQEKKNKKLIMKRDRPDRDPEVFVSQGKQMDREALAEYQRGEEEKYVKDEEEWEKQLENKGVLKLLSQNAKQNKFTNKRWAELEKLRKQKVYSRTTVRVVFPDGSMLQGRFGALETMGEVYDFVFEHLFDKSAEFTLYDFPPRRDFTDHSKTLHSLNLVPKAKLMFEFKAGYTSESDYALDMTRLKDVVKYF
jgi:hypothetical protein